MKFVAHALLRLEPILLAIVLAAFWFPEPSRVNFLLLFLLPLAARLILYRRAWINTPLNVLLVLLLIVCAVNTAVAFADPIAPPYSWGWYMIGRPLMGILLALSIISRVYEEGRIDRLVLITVLLALVVSALGLGSAQYTNKSSQLQFLIDMMPRITGFPGAEGGFNVNEIGGAMAYFAPLMAGIAVYGWRMRQIITLQMRFFRVVATLAFGVLALALFLGQSRLAIVGVAAGLVPLTLLLIPTWRWRNIVIAGLVVFSGLEVLIVARLFEPPAVAGAMIARDEDSNNVRLQIWDSALGIIHDYPLTGVGLNMFRARQVRDQYPAPGYSASVLPHAHNEILQIGSDLGIPGMILFVAWHGVLVVMVWRTWRKGEPFVKMVAVSAGAGLLAHIVFGFADAITLFDRFIFAYWLLVGMVGGAYVLTVRPPAELPVSAEAEVNAANTQTVQTAMP